jgi:hypothetical protein
MSDLLRLSLSEIGICRTTSHCPDPPHDLGDPGEPRRFPGWRDAAASAILAILLAGARQERTGQGAPEAAARRTNLALGSFEAANGVRAARVSRRLE